MGAVNSRRNEHCYWHASTPETLASPRELTTISNESKGNPITKSRSHVCGFRNSYIKKSKDIKRARRLVIKHFVDKKELACKRSSQNVTKCTPSVPNAAK